MRRLMHFRSQTVLRMANSDHTDGEVRIIEIGSRMGGDCIGSDLVPLSTGYDFMEMVIDVACGKEPRIVPKSAPKEARIHFLFTLDDVEKMKQYEKNIRTEI